MGYTIHRCDYRESKKLKKNSSCGNKLDFPLKQPKIQNGKYIVQPHTYGFLKKKKWRCGYEIRRSFFFFSYDKCIIMAISRHTIK